MISSMTGFGRHSLDTDIGEFAWELRSVNHRYLEVSLRLPEELRALETGFREQISKSVSRGKVEATLRIRAGARAASDITIDQDALGSLSSALSTVQQALGSYCAAADPLKVLQWPGVVGAGSDQHELMAAHAKASLAEALDDLVATREREGAKTGDMLRVRAAEIESKIAELKQHRPAVVARQREKLVQRLKELDIEHDAARLEQEIVYVAQRLDIDEELDRLGAHVSELQKAIKRSGPIGRRLDFLMQEFNREANTIGSKANDLDTTGASVDIKVLIEQMREQVQNVE